MSPTLRLALFTTAAAVAAGCTGFSLGEKMPGGDTWTEPPPPKAGQHLVGRIAVERDEDQLWVVHQENVEGELRAHLAAIDPDTGASAQVLDVSGATDRRVVFPSADRMILLAQRDGLETLVLFDTTTRTQLARTTKSTYYWGTRTSPSGRALVVADNAAPLAPLHVIDTRTLAHRVLPHGGDAVEAMWNHAGDVLIALSVTDPFGERPSAKLLRYDLRAHDLAQPLPAPTVVWQLDGYGWDLLFSFTWIGISPDDRWAVFPVVARGPGDGPLGGDHVLLVLDQTTGAVAQVPGRGPVGFTRDGGAIVSYEDRADGTGQDVVLIDPATHARRTVALPFDGGVSFHVMRDTDHVLATDVFAPTPLAIYDVAAGELRTANVAVGLRDFVSRPGYGQLFLRSGGALWSLDVGAGAGAAITLPGVIAGVNVRYGADQVVAQDVAAARIYRVAMATGALDGEPIALPRPSEAPAADSLGFPPDAGRRAPLERPRLVTRAAHDGDAHGLERIE